MQGIPAPIPFPDLDCIHWLDVDEPEDVSPPSESADTTSRPTPGSEKA